MRPRALNPPRGCRLTGLLALTCAAAAGTLEAGAAAGPPSFLVLLADDLGYADLGQDGSRIETPHLDRLARQGVKLTRFYTAPMCSPARAALLTGRYPHTVGMPELAVEKPRGPVPVLGLDHEAVTVAEALKARGYVSLLVGKWHLGFRREDWPRTHGFDEFWGSLAGTPGYVHPVQTYHNEEPITVDGYYTDRITDRAIEALEKHRARRFFLLVAYNAPHYPLEAPKGGPLEAPKGGVDKYRKTFDGDERLAAYAAMVERLDDGVGRILAALDRLDLAASTMVVFLSDNGPSPEPRSYGLRGARLSAGPLRGHKFSTFEGGIRVPFLARWPGKFPAGKVIGDVATVMDLMPAWLEAAGCPLPPASLHGRSILPLLSGSPGREREPLHWETRLNCAVLQGDWKLVRQFWLEKPFLYNLKDDPGERTDVAAAHPEKVAELEALHAAWQERCFPRPFPRPAKRPLYQFPED